jgi:hypothetical protein
VLLLALTAAGCRPKVEEQYSIHIVGPTGADDPLLGVKSVALEVAGREIARSTIESGIMFELSGGGLATDITKSGRIAVRGLDASDHLVSFGQTPEVELVLFTRTLQVFMQRPGSFGRTAALPEGRARLVAVPAVATPSAGSPTVAMTVPFFGLGEVLETAGTTSLNNIMRVYSPIGHTPENCGAGGQAALTNPSRADAAAIARPDGFVYVFGGVEVPPTGTVPPTPVASSQLDVLRVVRSGLESFQLSAEQSNIHRSDVAAVARSQPVLAHADVTYAFGGLGADGKELDTVVALEPAMTTAYTLLDPRMSKPRAGHTATVVTVNVVPEVLLFGGKPAAGAVAEVFIPLPTRRFMPTTGDAGPARWDHAAIPLQASGERILIVGGMSDAGPLATSLLYTARTHELTPGPITLKTARSAFMAFIVGNDLVIAGGLDAQGAPLPTAEIYDAADPLLAFRAMATPLARSRAAVVPMPNESVLILGGTERNAAGTDVPSKVLEIYQPLR